MDMEFIHFRLTCTFGNRIVGHLVKWTIVIILNCALISIKYRVVGFFCFPENGTYFGQFLYERCIRKKFPPKLKDILGSLYSCT